MTDTPAESEWEQERSLLAVVGLDNRLGVRHRLLVPELVVDQLERKLVDKVREAHDLAAELSRFIFVAQVRVHDTHTIDRGQDAVTPAVHLP